MPKELTIRVEGRGENVPAGAFVDAVQKTLILLRDLDARISESASTVATWEIVRVSMRSPLALTVAPTLSDSEEDTSERVIRAYLQGMREIESSPVTPPYFSEQTLRTARDLVSLIGNGLSRLVFSAPNETPVSPTLHSAANIDAVIEHRGLHEFIAIEGKLDTVSTHNYDHFFIWESVTNNRVQCRATPEQLEQAKAALRKRVQVYGRARYVHGKPTSMEVEAIRVLREMHELPQPKDIGKVDITGGMSSEDYIRGIRDGEG
jgi:hypothetical protein